MGGLVRTIFINLGGFAPPIAWSVIVLAAAIGGISSYAATGLNKIGAMAGRLFDRKGTAMIKVGLKKTAEAAFFAVAFHTIGLDALSL